LDKVPSLTDTQTFGPQPQTFVGLSINYNKLPREVSENRSDYVIAVMDPRLCLVLHIPQPFLCNPDHFGGMRLGFGAAGLKAARKSPR
jgi:hypothetical protein